MSSTEGECCAFRSFIAEFPCRREIYLEYGLTKLPHLVYNMYFTPLLSLLSQKLRSLILKTLQEVDRFIAVSNFVKSTICEHLGISPEKVDVIYTPLPNLPYIPREGSSRRITFTYIGALEAHKGVMNLLKAFHIAVSKDKNIKLLLCGTSGMERRIRDYIHDANFGKYVRILGKIDYARLHTVYQQTDVVVTPSLWPEPFARVVVEALCAGRPVIANPVGGLKEQIINNFNGFYVNCYDVNELAKGILNVSKTPSDELLQMGFRARKDALERFSPEKKDT